MRTYIYCLGSIGFSKADLQMLMMCRCQSFASVHLLHMACGVQEAMPIAPSLCGAGCSNLDPDLHACVDHLPSASSVQLDSNSQVKAVYSQSSQSTDSATISGSERPASRKRSRKLWDLEGDVLIQLDLQAAQPTLQVTCLTLLNWSSFKLQDAGI